LDLKGKKAVVTGGTRGIGRRVAEMLAEEGCDVAICARAPDEVEATVAALKSRNVRAHGGVFNVKDGETYKAWLSEACEALGGLDILICNVSAGGGMDSEHNWIRNFEIDVMGAVRGCEIAIPFLKKSSAGSIVILGTMASAETFVGPMAYNACKAALSTYAKQLAETLFKRNIRVNVVSPGPTVFQGSQWEMIELTTPKLFRSTIRQQPSRRFGTVDEIARCVLFVASPAASWVVGANLLVDGGFSRGVHF
jgi:NAD(P)-dependent dehydrogenase (short-subunit alcohol dehydrogenase family)